MSRKARLSGTDRLNLQEGRHTDTNDVQSSLILNKNDMFDTSTAALQILRSEIGGCPHGMRLSIMPVGQVRAFFVESALPALFSMKVIVRHRRINAPYASSLPFLTHVNQGRLQRVASSL